MTPDRDGFADSYSVSILFVGPPATDVAIAAPEEEELAHWSVERRGSHLRFACSGDRSEASASSVILDLRPSPVDPERIGRAISQSWSWEGARQAGRGATHSLALSDAGASSLPYRLRLERFQTVLVTVLRALPCIAIHWVPTAQLVDPSAFLAAASHEGPLTLLGAINVRLFQINEYDDGSPLDEPQVVMDTLGLSALGLDDLQCHFRRLPIDTVGSLLFDTACYLFERGAVIHGGDSIQGLDPDAPWRCEMEDAIIAPRRVVIDLDPGNPWAAGPRTRRNEAQQQD